MADLTQRIAALSPEKRALLEYQLKKKKVTHAVFPLAPAQQQLWLFDQLEPGNPTYTIPSAFRLYGHLNLAALERSLHAIVQRHASLRTTIVASQAEPTQVVASFLSLPLPVIDLTALAASQEREAEAQRQIDAEALLPFDLARGPLIRARLLRLSEAEHVLLITLHHIIADGWSIGILVQDLTALYSTFVNGSTSPSSAKLPELSITYPDYALWQQSFVESEAFAQHLAYWKRQLAHAPALLELPTDYLRPVAQPFRGKAETLTLSSSLASDLQALSQREGVSLFMTLLSLFAVQLSRLTGEEDMLIGSPFANRDRAELEHLIGFFLNTLVLRVDLSGGPTFLELLRGVRETCLSAYEHRDMPFDRLVAELNPERHLSYNPLFQVFFNLLNIETLPTEPVDLAGLHIELPMPFQVAAKFDLALYAQERQEGLSLELIYNTALFEPTRMRHFLEQFASLAQQVVAHPEQPISQYSLLSPRMQALLPDPIAWLSDAWMGAVSKLFAQQAERVPTQLAAIDMYGQWSYEELDRCSNQIANYLRAQDIQPQERVAIFAHRSASLVCAIMGILKAGAVYVILDPLYPALRLIEYFQQAEARGLIQLEAAGPVPPALEEALLDTKCRLELPRNVASISQMLGAYPPTDPAVEIGPDDLACIAFTSGSTGRPRGVLQRHGPLSHFLPEQQRLFGLTEADRYSMLTGISSDPLQRDIFTPLCLGATICIPSPEEMMTPGWLADWMQHQRISIAHLTPAMVRLLTQTRAINSVIPSLRLALIVGDMLTKHDVAELSRLAPSVTCVNLYGSTETQRAVGYYILPASDKAASDGSSLAEVAHLPKEGVPLGRGFTDVQVLILNGAQQLAGIGELGEIAIRSPHLAKGYVAEDLLTQEHFITNPFTGRAADRLYRTGDLGRYRPDGTIEYAGRTDYQVKLRGFRIELGEIEAMLRLHPAVQETVVVVRATASQREEMALVAYVVTGAEERGNASLKHDLWLFLRARLPSYMVPAAFVLLEALPLLPNRKVDRAALPPPEWSNGEEGLDERGPLTPTEEILTGLWTQILGRARIGMHEDFFELGGHSLLATQLMARIASAFQVTLPLRSLFEAPTISELAALIDQQTSRPKLDQSSPPPEVIIVPDLEHRFQPFPLSDVQQAYWIGRSADFELGNVATHVYVEWESYHLDLKRFSQAWRRLIERHEMLRAIVLPDGQQQILEEVPPYEIAVQDLRGLPPQEVQARLEDVCQEMSHQVLPTDRWPLFDLRASLLDGERVRLHRSTDSLMIDAWSWRILLRELDQLYCDPEQPLPELTLSFRDYLLAERALQKSETYKRAQNYWWRRVADLPPAPELPLAQNPAALAQPRFKRYSQRLEAALWSQLKQNAARFGLTPSGVLLAAFSRILGTWSKNPHFTINLTLFNRQPLHAQINEIVGDFTSLLLLAVDQSEQGSFVAQAKRVQTQLWEDLEHRSVSGVAVMRELARLYGHTARARMPVVFTSILGVQDALRQAAPTAQGTGWRQEEIYSITQTPQVWLDHQVGEQDGALRYLWDVVDDLFPAGLVDAMFSAYHLLLTKLATEEQWDRITDASLLPPAQVAQRAALNATDAPVSTMLLHSLFTEQAARCPNQPAVIAPQRSLSYQEVQARATQIGRLLRQRGLQPNQLVAVVMEKGWEQVVGTLGVLFAGAAYLPIDPELPQERLHYLLKHGEVQVALTQAKLNRQLPWPKDVKRISVDQLGPGDPATLAPLAPVQQPEDLAYVIYTSGSTGVPKGVMIDHRGAVNTILDINERFGVGSEDRILALSSLSFDLSVYDIFGIFAAGGTIVLPSAEARGDPAHWIQLVQQERVTIWNSVPALMELAISEITQDHMQPTQRPRLVMLSGDWIPGGLPQQIWSVWKDTQVISLGGATEASIWSILFPIEQVDPTWKSIPYGHPMRNQRFHVLNPTLEPCPVWVPGELFIGGIGLAQGYWRDEEKSAARFFQHPKTGERLYRTGDLGRYLPTGEIEFLGREDFQVKIRGYRIELGEIESVLSQQPGVAQVVAVAREDTPGDKRLVAYVVAASGSTLPAPATLQQAVQQKLPEYMTPAAIVPLTAFPLTPNGKVDRQALPAPVWGSEGASQQEQAALLPGSVDERLSALWRQTLDIPSVSIHDNFFELGGHSVLAVQLLSRVYAEFQVKVPLRALFDGPTIAELSKHLAPPPSGAMSASQSVSQKSVQPKAVEVMDDPVQRAAFKAKHLALRKDRPGSWSIHLSAPDLDEIPARVRYERRSARAFGSDQVSLQQLNGLLSCLRQSVMDGEPKYLWGSAGGAYPIQAYLHIKPERVEAFPGGLYYYHPADHRLAAITPDASIGPEVHALVNQLLYEQSAFSIFLVGHLDAITPLYGERSRDFCLIEVGSITQLLEMTAPAYRLGLSQIGSLDFQQIEQMFDLSGNSIYLHGLLGGCMAAEKSASPS